MVHGEVKSEQKLIDIMFEIAQASYMMDRERAAVKEYYNEKRDEHMKWVADQLRMCGFETVPAGLSWGVLKSGL
jgi:hypothetical protein